MDVVLKLEASHVFADSDLMLFLVEGLDGDREGILKGIWDWS